MAKVEKFNMDMVGMLIEIRGVYDGWSVAVLKDGRIYNRWANSKGWFGESRWIPTEDYINMNFPEAERF